MSKFKLQLKNVQKKYPKADFYSVRDFNLDVEEGELIVFVGPSGCGKSTTLRMIAGLEDITDGELIIDGKVVNDVSSKNRDIAMVFQSYALYPHMSVRDNIGYGLKLRKEQKSVIDQKVTDIAEDLGLTDFLERKPKDLSGGQRQRVALGRAMVRKPVLYLMDEPLSNLDAKLRTSTRTEIARMHRVKGAVTVYVTHDQVEAMTMADRIVVMSTGEIQQIGTPKELYLNPKNKFVATFIGQPPMNTFETVYKDGCITMLNTTFPIDAGDAKILDKRGYNGKKIIVGLRSQAFSDTPLHLQAHPQSIIKVNPVNVEYLGESTSIFFESDDKQLFVASLGASSMASVGDMIDLAVETSKLHFFDGETEMSIKYEEALENNAE